MCPVATKLTPEPADIAQQVTNIQGVDVLNFGVRVGALYYIYIQKSARESRRRSVGIVRSTYEGEGVVVQRREVCRQVDVVVVICVIT